MLVQRRTDMRVTGDFQRADAIQRRLARACVTLSDEPGGGQTTWKQEEAPAPLQRADQNAVEVE